jgi:methyltransferase (TIGR00027 family)
MKPHQVSQTAEYMAFFRASESVRPPQRRMFVDSLAVQFIRPSLRIAVWLSKMPAIAKLVNWYADRRLPGARTSAIARTRFIDDVLANVVEKGVGQVVILGAGFDCRAYRLRYLDRTTIFEVDHPVTLARKKAKLHEVLPKVPDNVRYVQIDFMEGRLSEELLRGGFESSRRAVFLWEGVTNYLTAEAVDAVLRYVASCRPGSQIIFTYVHSGILDGSVRFDGGDRLLRDVARLGERWTFGLSPDQLAEFLRGRGLCLDCDLSAREYRGRYFGGVAKGMKGYEFYHVAVAHLPTQEEARGSAES